MLLRIFKEYGGNPTAYDGGYAPCFQMLTTRRPGSVCCKKCIKAAENSNKKNPPRTFECPGRVKSVLSKPLLS